MSKTGQKSFCHNCGDQVDPNTIYCNSCLDGENDVTVEDSSDGSETWGNIKDSEAGQKANVAHDVVQLAFMLLALAAIVSFGAKYVFGVASAPTTLVVFLMVILTFVTWGMKQVWPEFKLRTQT